MNNGVADTHANLATNEHIDMLVGWVSAAACERRLSLGCVFTPPCCSLLYALIDDPRRCKWRGGTLRHLGQNSLGLYIISEVIGDLLDSFCVGGTDHHHCSDDINFKRDVQHFFRRVGGSEENEVRRRHEAWLTSAH